MIDLYFCTNSDENASSVFLIISTTGGGKLKRSEAFSCDEGIFLKIFNYDSFFTNVISILHSSHKVLNLKDHKQVRNKQWKTNMTMNKTM